eukprot:TRINITY_DN113701_c0_g1_i1.p1 TRINITY_DN113701_c0_g1~~TRINITY_DN113701_c0_g1_i1.p1  ORF type:complete len:156 (+),score=10.40 TRINITY_DN113701_c0_g1_i1:41-469(+)
MHSNATSESIRPEDDSADEADSCSDESVDLTSLFRGSGSEETLTHAATSGGLTQAEIAELESKVRRTDEGMPTSIGSQGHPEACSPCLFAFSTARCSKGLQCRYCHFHHPGLKTKLRSACSKQKPSVMRKSVSISVPRKAKQ